MILNKYPLGIMGISIHTYRVELTCELDSNEAHTALGFTLNVQHFTFREKIVVFFLGHLIFVSTNSSQRWGTLHLCICERFLVSVRFFPSYYLCMFKLIIIFTACFRMGNKAHKWRAFLRCGAWWPNDR
jgi:hypothetical protein